MNDGGIVRRPADGKWFFVDPEKLNFDFAKYPRKDEKQEEARVLINEAKEELMNNPERYMRPFSTFIPYCKAAEGRKISELMEFSKKFGDSMANWVEQSLEWAQRINNGETWYDICCKPDSCRYYRIIQWKNGNVRFFGGASEGPLGYGAATIGKSDWYMHDKVYYAVPLVVKYL